MNTPLLDEWVDRTALRGDRFGPRARVAVGRMAALLAAEGCTHGGADEALELVAAFLLTDPTLPALRLSAV